MKNYLEIETRAIKLLCEEKEKEWFCHIQFVKEIALELAERFNGDKEIVSIAAILHDIGRDKEQPGEDHRITSVRISNEFLNQFNLEQSQLTLILRCIGNHGADEEPLTVEEKIIISADSASKVLYHQAFMLMVNKKTFTERAEWGLKYVEKGYNKIQFPEYKQELKQLYNNQKSIYHSVINK